MRSYYLKYLMLVLCLFFIPISFNLANDSGEDKLNKLIVLNNNYPRAFFFRRAEHTYEPYKAWESNVERLMGIEGKCLEEELVGRSEPNIEFFTRFKQNHPQQLVLLHFNGNARDPRFEREAFFPGHWLYFEGSRILTDIPATQSITDIFVEDASLFKVNIGRYNNRNEDIGLCELDENGRPNWHKSEQVQLVSVDTVRDIIRVKRGSYGTRPRAFPSGSYAAAHVWEGQWGEENNLLWYYNHSTYSPEDLSGKQSVDVLVEDIAQRFSQQGKLNAFDGLEFDVLYSDVMHHKDIRYFGRLPDCNGDGIGDKGIFDDKNTYAIGVHELCKKLRNRLGDDRIILADGMGDDHQRAFGILNGIESEGWPTGADYYVDDWSGGLNRFLFWHQNAKKPVLNYLNHRWWARPDYPEIPYNINRLVIASSVLTGSAFATQDLPGYKPGQWREQHEPLEMGEYYPLWDELVMGQAQKLGWLGSPNGPPSNSQLSMYH